MRANDPHKDADHFVVVAGIDTDKQIVHLNDPAAEYAAPARTRSS